MKKLINLNLKLTQLTTFYQAANTQSSGLKQPQVEERQKRYGMNQLKKADKEPIVLTFIKNFTSLMAILLWVGGGIAILSHSLELGLVIWFVNIVNGIFSFVQEYRASQATEALKKKCYLPMRVLFVRDKKRKS